MWNRTYDAGAVSISIGAFLVTGYADGTYCRVAYNDNEIREVVGAEGEVTRVKGRNRTGLIEITLMQTSPTNNQLLALATADRKDGSGIFAIQVKDPYGMMLYSGNQAWVKKPPEGLLSRQAEHRVWTILVAQLAYEPQPDPSDFSLSGLLGKAAQAIAGQFHL
jgi:hypothetical protein